MNIAESSVKFPITVIVRVLLVVVFGYVCLTFLTVELKPETEPPVIVVSTQFPGAAPEEVEGEVTTQFEEAISGVSNMMYTFGYALYGRSFIICFFHPGTNLDLAAAEVQRNIDRVGNLPSAVEKPEIFKASERINLPVYQFALTGNVDLVTMSTWAEKEITPAFKRVPGVGDCQYDGNRDREMQVVFDKERLKARGLTVEQVKEHIDRTNLNQSGGYFVEGDREWIVRTVGELLSAQQFRNIIISKPGDPIVYLSDVATVEDKYERPDSYCRINGKQGIVFSVYSQVGANLLATIEGADKKLALMQKEFGPLVAKFEKLYDQSAYIRDAVSIVRECLIEALVLVLLVLFVFLKRWRSIVIVATSIPVSIIGTFIGMYLFGYSINVLSLAGLALSMGLIVDDAIVVLENIYRHRYEEGKNIYRACVDGTREVGMAALMCTLTTAAVFMPVLMLKGEIGSLFGPVAFVISFAIFMSLFDAFTVVPMLASRWMREERAATGIARKVMAPLYLLDRVGSAAARGILGSLAFFLGGLGRKFALIAFVLILLGVSLYILPGMGYLPTGGTNLIKVQIDTYEGLNLDERNSLMTILEKRWRKIKGVRNIVTVPSRNSHRNAIYLICDREEESGVPISAVARKAVASSKDLPLSGINPIQFPLFGNIHTRSSIVDVRLLGLSYEILGPIVHQIESFGKKIKGVVFTYTDLALKKPQVEIRVDHQRAAYLGFDVKDIADAVEAAIGGQRTKSQYDSAGRYYYIRVMGDERHVTSVSDVGNIILTSPRNPEVQVPLSSVATIKTSFGPLRINHYNMKRSARVQFTIEGRPLADVYKELEQKIKEEVAFPPRYSFMPHGAVSELKSMIEAIRFVFPLSCVIVYLLLVMQFQSFLRPLSILLSVPLSIIGANFIVALTGVNFDSFT
ncbi:MAG: efflux RND transporter permease subunit, partial [Deltaproteobacteria bacterium]